MTESFYDKLYAHVTEMLAAPLPQDVRDKALLLVFDTLNCCRLGVDERRIAGMLDSGTFPPGDAVRIGRPPTNAESAAFWNSAMAQVYDVNDGCRMGSKRILRSEATIAFHPARVVIPTVLALSAEMDVSGEQLLKAIVGGYEVALSVCSYACAVYGATFAAGCLYGLTRDEMSHALGIAHAITPRRLFRPDAECQDHDPVNTGIWARNAVTAAGYARVGMTAPVIDDLDEPEQHDYSSAFFAEQYKIRHAYIKLAPTCRATHTAVGAAQVIAEPTDFGLDDIAEVVIELGPASAYVRRQKLPAAMKARMFDVAFAVSCALLHGRVSPAHLRDDWDGRADVGQLYARTRVVINPAHDLPIEDGRPATVRVSLRSGRVIEQTVAYAKGDPEAAYTSEELIARWTLWHEGSPTESELRALWDTVQGLPMAERVAMPAF
jgi:2-methylcitrate dehydratase PrpD